jgi:hypothetical protein
VSRSITIDRSQFRRDGFVVVPGLLTADETEAFAPIFSQRLPPDTQPPGVPGNSLNGRKTLISDHTDPRLSNLAGHPNLIEVVAQLAGPFFLIQSTSAPVITYKSPPGTERFAKHQIETMAKRLKHLCGLDQDTQPTILARAVSPKHLT